MKEPTDYPDPLELAEALTHEPNESVNGLPPGIEAWINASPANRASYQALTRVWQARRDSRSSPNEAQEALANLRTRLGYEHLDMSSQRVPERNFVSRGFGGWRSYAAVAAVALVAITGTFLTPMLQTNQDSMITASYVSQFGETPIIKLPDGSTVILNAASSIQVTNSNNERVVSLNGEAMFNVVPDSKRPFIVKTSDIYTTVLGTEFGVRAYDDSEVTVAVKSGRVMVEACKESTNGGVRDICKSANSGTGGRLSTQSTVPSVILSANEMIVAGNQHAWQKSPDKNIDKALAFTEGRLVLDNIPLAKAIPDLNRWYGAAIRVVDEDVGEIPLRGSLPHGSIEDLEQALRITLNANIVRSGRTITISRGNN